MNPRKRRQRVVTVFDGRTHMVALCRGFREGLPVFGWGEAPPTLLTRGQLRSVGLCPGGQDPLALLVFRHHRPYARETVAPLFSVELAAERPPAVPGQTDAANRALRTCVTCTVEQNYRCPTSTRQCWECFDAETEALLGGPVTGEVAA